jgi:N-acetylated-alpha-linked acidic dipeptidase
MRSCRALVSVTLSFLLPIGLLGQSGAIRGFLVREIPDEERLEQQLQAVPDTAHLRRYMNFMAAQPHAAGSARSKAVAEYVLGLLKEWGLDAQIEQFDALMPYPTLRQLEVLAPKPYIAKLREPPVSQDPDSSDPQQLPTYNAYGASGDVTGEVVYANYGLPDDYDWLNRQGISVRGKIVITRYGKSWRGLKPKLAAEHGAIACLIYSDPHEDGYFEGDIFPLGPMRPPDGVQRGSVLDMTLYPGDPLSPGWASESGSKRLPITDARTLMKIPVLPLSYADAQPILDQLSGPLVPRDWRGALPLTYHAGPGPTTVHIKTDYDWTTKPLYDVVATIPGTEEADEWVLAGNHHDAWVNGADDPVSGAVALLETGRALAALEKQGWRPKRTIKLAFWDGEEFGLLGSTEWVEKHQDELRQKAVAYLNSDNTGRGWLSIGGSHTLEDFVNEVAHSVPQPGTNATLADYALHHPSNDSPDSYTPARSDGFLRLDALGAGSDFQGFLDYLGIASMNEGFEGQTKSGIYHSIYDSIYWYTHFSDTTQVDGRALSQFTATALLRLANASVLPFEFGRLAATINHYTDEIQRQIDTGGHRVDLAGIRKQLDELRDQSQNYEALLEVTVERNALDASRLAQLNRQLLQSERALTRPEGLPNRPWYKHQIYAPGFYTGYSVKTLPGIREAVENKNWKLAQQEAGIVEQCLSDMNRLVSEATSELSGL